MTEGFFRVIILRRDDTSAKTLIFFIPPDTPVFTVVFHIVRICSLATPPKVLIIIITGISVNMVYDTMEGVSVRDEYHTDEAMDEHRNKGAWNGEFCWTAETRVRS